MKKQTKKNENSHKNTEDNSTKIPEEKVEIPDESASEKDEKTDHLLSEEEETFKLQLIRLKAEFQNYKKRTEREKFELSSFVKIELIKRFLPVLDDILRVRENFESDSRTLKDALSLVFPKIEKFLENEKITKIAKKGDEFDPNFHEALMQQVVESEADDGKVLDVFEQGYTLDERIIRFAKVQVGKK